MISIFKTAIITIIISFISGLLLEHYKNLAPRILCNIGNGIPLELNNKKICAYILTVRNISNKTIHKLTLNIQGSQNNLKIGDAKITKGLKFDSSTEDNSLDVYIPFLSKYDEFSVTLYVENQYGEYNKPVVTIRSPEDFKEVDSVEQKGILFLLFNIPKNTNKVVSKSMKNNETIVSNKKGDFTTVMNKAPGAKKTKNKENREILHRSKKLSKNKKAMIAIVSIILVISIGVLGGFYSREMSINAQTNVQKQSTDVTESVGGTTKSTGVKSSKGVTTGNIDTKTSTGGTTKNSGTKTSTDRTTKNTDTKTSTDVTTKNPDAKTSIGETTGNPDAKTSIGETTGNPDAKTSIGGTTGNADSKTSTGETTGSTDTKTSTDVTTKNTDTKTSTSGITGNTDAKTSTGETTGNTDAKTSASGTTGDTGN